MAIKSCLKWFRLQRNKRYQRHANVQWEPGFFDFASIADTPDFSEYRKELKLFNEDSLK